ncbi:antigen presentation protein SpaN [Salmonella enterica subsp. enterica serovar Agona str. 266757-1]|nr:antigen presentation protein SpaN [Salmonella enterica subsp. enterica serovar Agona str. 266757-1]
MGDVSAVSSSGNILLPQQDEVGGLSEALKKRWRNIRQNIPVIKKIATMAMLS